MSLPSTDENFSPDADKNGIQGTLENAIPNLKAVLNPTLVAPVVGPVHAAAPVPSSAANSSHLYPCSTNIWYK